MLSTPLLQVTAPHLLLHTSAPVHVGMSSHQQMVFTVKPQQCHYSHTAHRKGVGMLLIKSGLHVQNTAELLSPLVPK